MKIVAGAEDQIWRYRTKNDVQIQFLAQVSRVSTADEAENLFTTKIHRYGRLIEAFDTKKF